MASCTSMHVTTVGVMQARAQPEFAGATTGGNRKPKGVAGQALTSARPPVVLHRTTTDFRQQLGQWAGHHG